MPPLVAVRSIIVGTPYTIKSIIEIYRNRLRIDPSRSVIYIVRSKDKRVVRNPPVLLTNNIVSIQQNIKFIFVPLVVARQLPVKIFGNLMIVIPPRIQILDISTETELFINIPRKSSLQVIIPVFAAGSRHIRKQSHRKTRIIKRI